MPRPRISLAFLRDYWQGWCIALTVALGALLAGETLVAHVEHTERKSVLARAEIGAGVAKQIIIRRLEAVEVLHRLTQSWLLLGEAGNSQGQAALEVELAETANTGRFGFIQLAAIGRDGWMLWSSTSNFGSPIFLGDREHFQVHVQGHEGLFVSRPVLGRVSNRWSLQFTRLLKDRNGDFGGVVVVSMDVYDLSEALAEVLLQPSDHILLIRDDGTISAQSDDAPHSIGQALPDNDPLRSLPAEQASGAMFRNEEPFRPVATGWQRLPDTPLTVTYEVDLIPALAAMRSTRTLIRGMAGAVAVVALMIAGLATTLAERSRARLAALRSESERHLAEMAHATYSRRIAGLPAVVYGGEIRPGGGFILSHVSDSLTRITGWPIEALLTRRDWRDLMEPSEAEAQDAFFRAVLASGEGLREYRLSRPGGDRIWVRDSVRVVDRSGDGTAEIVGYLADISEEREIHMKAQASARLATLGEMAAGLAHELNQPLAVMSLAADNAARALEKRGAAAVPDAQRRLQRIAQQALRARDVVDHLRVFGRPDEGKPEPIALASAVDGAIVLTAGALRSAGIAVEIDLPTGLPPVMARLVPLEQALVNLLLNARDAIEEKAGADSREGWIRISARTQGETVALTVADSGGGIPEAAIDRLFEPFFTTKAPGKGTGLGLSICHAAMRAFGGSITVRNGPEGAVFTMTFRTAQANQPTDAHPVPAD